MRETYCNNNFHKITFESKYKKIIEDEIKLLKYNIRYKRGGKRIIVCAYRPFIVSNTYFILDKAYKDYVI